MENTQNTSQPQNQNTPSNKPELVVRDGSLKATVWRNEGDKGTYYTTSLAKTYTDQQGNPRDTQNFSQTELLRVAELGREAYGMISELKRQHSLENSQNQSHAQDCKNFKQSRRPNGHDVPKSQSF